jgi:hypothetical protein
MTAFASNSVEQRVIEHDIVRALASHQGLILAPTPDALRRLKIDAYAPGSPPVLVEVFTHVGRAKPGQRRKVMHDMAKLLLAERRLGVHCRKVLAVIDPHAVAYLGQSWDGTFAREFDVEVIVVKGFAGRHTAMLAAQERQARA